MSDRTPASSRILLPSPDGRPPFALLVGGASAGAPSKSNEDFYGVALPPEAYERGALLAIADGISATGDARSAAEMTVRSMLADFYATPADWSASRALDRLLESANDWLASENRRRPANGGVVAALSVLVLHPTRYCIAHVGDTRVYRIRGGVLEQITQDHTWPRRDMRHVLKRAVGLDSHLVADFEEGDVQEGDTFVMLTDGVWDVLDGDMLRSALLESHDAQAAAERLVAQSIKRQATYMGRNDATAVVATIVSP